MASVGQRRTGRRPGLRALGAMADRFGCRPFLVWIYSGRALALAGLFLIREQPAALLLAAALAAPPWAGPSR